MRMTFAGIGTLENAIADLPETGQLEVARTLLTTATVTGAHALGLRAGTIAAGALADLVSIDLAHGELAGATDETLPASVVFGAGDGGIDGVCVGGDWRGAER